MCECCDKCKKRCPQNLILIIIGVTQIFIFLFGITGLGLNSLVSESGYAINEQVGELSGKVTIGFDSFTLEGTYRFTNGTINRETYTATYQESYNFICKKNDIEDEDYCQALDLFVAISSFYVAITSLVMSLIMIAGIYCVILACIRRGCCKRSFGTTEKNSQENKEFKYQCLQCCRCLCSFFSEFGICLLDLLAGILTILGIVILIVCDSINLGELLTDLTNNYYTQQVYEMEWTDLTPGDSIGLYVICCLISIVMFIYLLLSIILTFCCQCCQCCGYLVPKVGSIFRDDNNKDKDGILDNDLDEQRMSVNLVPQGNETDNAYHQM